MHDENTNDQQHDGAELYVGGQIVARLEKQPDRENRSDEAVEGHEVGDLMGSEGQRVGPGSLCKPVSAGDTGQQEHHADGAGHTNFDLSGSALEHIEAHEDGDGDGHADGEDAPRAVREGVDDHDAKARERDQEDQENREHGDQTREGTYFSARNVGKGTPLMAHGSDERDQIVYATGQHRSNEYPEEARSETKLGGESGTDQGTRTGDGGEVMAEKNPLGRGHVVVTVLVNMSRSAAAVVQSEGLCGDEGAVIAVANRVNAKGSEENRESVHEFCLVRRSGPSVETEESALGAKSEDVLSQAMPDRLAILVRIGNAAANFPEFKTW